MLAASTETPERKHPRCGLAPQQQAEQRSRLILGGSLSRLRPLANSVGVANAFHLQADERPLAVEGPQHQPGPVCLDCRMGFRARLLDVTLALVPRDHAGGGPRLRRTCDASRSAHTTAWSFGLSMDRKPSFETMSANVIRGCFGTQAHGQDPDERRRDGASRATGGGAGRVAFGAGAVLK